MKLVIVDCSQYAHLTANILTCPINGYIPVWADPIAIVDDVSDVVIFLVISLNVPSKYTLKFLYSVDVVESDSIVFLNDKPNSFQQKHFCG
jgi:hypothetical protein